MATGGKTANLEMVRDLFGIEPGVAPPGAARQPQEGCARLELDSETTALLSVLLGLPVDPSAEVLALGHEQGMPHWEACGKIVLGWAQYGDAESLPLIRSGVDTLGILGTRTSSVIWFSALTEAALASGAIAQARAAIDAARSFVESTNERCLEAELARLEARVILAEDPTAAAAADERLQNAIVLATRRGQVALVARAERQRAELIRA
jgi:hypothetical protein